MTLTARLKPGPFKTNSAFKTDSALSNQFSLQNRFGPFKADLALSKPIQLFQNRFSPFKTNSNCATTELRADSVSAAIPHGTLPGRRS
jgi:hypothetical protein